MSYAEDILEGELMFCERRITEYTNRKTRLLDGIEEIDRLIECVYNRINSIKKALALISESNSKEENVQT